MPFPRCFDVSRFVSHMRDENFPFSCLNACDLIALNSSSISCIFPSLWDLLLSLIPCLIFMLMSLTWALIFSFHIFRLSMRAESSWSFAVDGFLFACCSYSCGVRKYFCLFVCDCCRRLLPKYFCHIAAVALVACCCLSFSVSSFAADAVVMLQVFPPHCYRRRHCVLPIKYF